MSFKVSETESSHLKNGNNNYTCLIDLVVNKVRQCLLYWTLYSSAHNILSSLLLT